VIDPRARGVIDVPPEPVIGLAKGETRWRSMTRASVRQFNTRLLSGLSSEKVGTSISNISPLSLTIW
jgi:hypothetical protein